MVCHIYIMYWYVIVIYSKRRVYPNLFRIEFFLEFTEKLRKNNMLSNIVRTKNLILELIPPRRISRYFLIIYCKNLLIDHYVFIYWDEFLDVN